MKELAALAEKTYRDEYARLMKELRDDHEKGLSGVYGTKRILAYEMERHADVWKKICEAT